MPAYTPPPNTGTAHAPVVMPYKAMEAISYVSAVVGRDFPESTPTPVRGTGPGGSVSWPTDVPDSDPDRRFAAVEWADGVVLVTLDPDSDHEWDRAYKIIGYCTYHGIAWEAP